MDGASKSAGAASPFVLPALGHGTPFEAPPRAGLPLHPRHPKEGLGAADTNPRAWSAQRTHKHPYCRKGVGETRYEATVSVRGPLRTSWPRVDAVNGRPERARIPLRASSAEIARREWPASRRRRMALRVACS